VARLEMGGQADAAAGEKAPWERRAELGVVSAWLQTLKAVITGPSGFFERLDKTEQSNACLFIPIINQTIVATASFVWGLLFAGMIAAATGDGKSPLAAMLFVQGGMGVVAIVVAPLAAVIGVYVGAGLTHLFLAVTKKATAPFQQTMRCWCYASSPGIFGVVPIVGAIAGLWSIVVQIIAIMKLHRTSGGIATLAVLWWLLLAGCCGAIAGFTLLAGMFASHAK